MSSSQILTRALHFSLPHFQLLSLSIPPHSPLPHFAHFLVLPVSYDTSAPTPSTPMPHALVASTGSLHLPPFFVSANVFPFFFLLHQTFYSTFSSFKIVVVSSKTMMYFLQRRPGLTLGFQMLSNVAQQSSCGRTPVL